MIKYYVLDDYGDTPREDWDTAPVIFTGNSLLEVEEWAENNNYHSATIISKRITKHN